MFLSFIAYASSLLAVLLFWQKFDNVKLIACGGGGGGGIQSAKEIKFNRVEFIFYLLQKTPKMCFT